MNIYTYWQPVPELNMIDEFRLLLLWRENWIANGFSPVVLNEYVAQQHPYFEEYNAIVSQFPTVNPVAYERACFLRHLAMAQAGGGFLCDYDVMCRQPIEFVHEDIDRLNIYQKGANGTMVPCLVSGCESSYVKLCRYFASHIFTPEDNEAGKPHISDQNALQKIIATHPEDFNCLNEVVGYGEPGWEKAAFVHFSNGNTGPAGKTPRYKHVTELMNQS